MPFPSLPDRVLTTRHPYALLAVFCLVLWLPGFFTLPPSDRDESRFAEATRQMIDSGDYVRIRNGDEARNQKPIGIYWLQVPFVAAARATGLATPDDIWPYRMPSLLGGLLAVLGTYRLGAVLAGPRAALLAAAMLASATVLVTETHIAKTDAALLAASVAVMGLLARAYLSPAAFSRRLAALFWLALGVTILIKGPVIPMIAALCAASLRIADRGPGRSPWLARLRTGWGVALMLLVVLPWFVAIGIATNGQFFHQSLGGDLGGKLAGGDDAHGAPPGFHFLLLAVTLFPSSFVVLPALAAAWQRRRAPAVRFLLAWLVPAWLVFEAVPTKLPHYTLPLFPALCLLGAGWMVAPAPGFRLLRRVSAVHFALGAVALAAAAGLLPVLLRPHLEPAAALGLPVLAAVLLLAWLVLRTGEASHRIGAALLTMPLVTWLLLGLELPALHDLWIAPRVVAALPGGRVPPGGFASVGFAEPSLRFLAGADTRLLGDGRAGARYLAAAPARAVAVAAADLPAFEAEAARLRVPAERLGVVTGFNYSRGRPVALTLFQTPP